jgi:hypothetical protein
MTSDLAPTPVSPKDESMEITEHERLLLVTSLIQTISELYEHDGDKDRAALRRCLPA